MYVCETDRFTLTLNCDIVDPSLWGWRRPDVKLESHPDLPQCTTCGTSVEGDLLASG